jgi:hypothetical protein
MPFTQNCDLFGSVNEQAINNVVLDLQRQRPSLFNYGTEAFVAHPKLLCNQSVIGMLDPDVHNFGNPVVSLLPLVGIPGYTGPFGLEFCLQLSELKIDFQPSNSIVLPAGLNPPLAAQHFALQAKLCAGLGCPDMSLLGQIIPVDNPFPTFGNQSAGKQGVGNRNVGNDQASANDKGINTGISTPTRPFPFRKPICFCLDLFVVLHVDQVTTGGDTMVSLVLDGVEIPELKPIGMEKIIECYIRTTLNLGILPQIKIAFSSLVFKIADTIPIHPTPISAAVPFNPNIEKDQLQVFISLN